jgi:hypothetical protein
VGTVHQAFTPEGYRALSSTFPQYRSIAGTNFPVSSLGYDASADEAAMWKWVATNYGSGNLTADLWWYADTGSSGDVVWGAAIAAITANTDTQDVETDAFATENTATDSHLGTTAQRVHHIAVTVSNLDSVAANDIVWLRVRRVGSSGSDTMTGDANLLYVRLSYSDT